MPDLVHQPLTGTPARQANSARRTSHIDMIPTPDGLVLRGSARDVATDAHGVGTVVASADVDATLDGAHTLRHLTLSPETPAADDLVGRTVGRGFRAAAMEVAPLDHQQATPLALLLDDLPVAALISGYAMLYSGAIDTRDSTSALKADICAGWRSDGTMMVSVRRGDGVPVPFGPPAPVLEHPDDDLSWHPVPPLPAGAMRRRRLVEVTEHADRPVVWAMFRDSHVDGAGAETVVHEYSLAATIDRTAETIASCQATPSTLPWTECPAAADSAGRLAGVALTAIRDHVGSELRGTSTCTHLNDLLRSLGDLTALLTLLDRS